MRILLAPDKFKGSLTAIEVCRAMADGIASVDAAIEIDSCPLADGGEGTVSALVNATGGTFITRRVTGPLPEMKVDATFGVLGDAVPSDGSAHQRAHSAPTSPPAIPKTAVIEMSAASGIALLKPHECDPLATTTFGTGELILHAIDEGCRRIILGIGGSATTDAGIGCAQACGLPVLLENGEPTSLSEPLCGCDVARVVLVKHGRGDRLGGVEIIVACDVTNTLYGPNGAAKIFGPQKGATPEVAARLDRDLQQLASRVGNIDLAQTPGTGAAGGLGFGLLAFFGATLRPGIDIVLEATRFTDRIRNADLCLTGEGKLDGQSAAGKTIAGVAGACRSAGVPCIAIAGTIGEGIQPLLDRGLTASFSICDGPMTLNKSIARAPRLIARATANVVRLMIRR